MMCGGIRVFMVGGSGVIVIDAAARAVGFALCSKLGAMWCSLAVRFPTDTVASVSYSCAAR